MNPRPGQTLTHYSLVEKIGEGGMGVVWEARDVRLKRPVALKLLPADLIDDPQRRGRFLREAQAAAALNHPNIAAVYEADEADGVSFIVMELVRGRTLRSLLTDRPMPIQEVIRIGTGIADGLAEAHRAGIVHRDLKPDNVMIGTNENPKILDFGLARLLPTKEPPLSPPSGAETRTEELTREGRLIGTAAYMSPEQARGEVVDARSDVFSFGIMLYEMVTGSRPFRGATKIDQLSAILKDEVAPAVTLNPGVPAALDSILARCLDKSPARRYRDAGELLADLRRLGPASTGDQALPQGSRRWALRSALAILVMAGLIAAARLVWSVRPGRVDARTVLILPMEMRGQGEGAAYAGRAFAETLAVELARAGELSVLRVPEAGEEGLSGGGAGVQAALRAGAGRLVTGALTREENHLSASITLVDTTRDRVIGGFKQEAEGRAPSSVASALARELILQLGVTRPRQYDFFIYSTQAEALANSADWKEAVGALDRFEVPAALEATRRLVERFPQDADSHVLRSNAFLFAAWEKDRTSPEIAAFEASLMAIDRADPANPWDEVFRAFARQRGEPRESVEEFSKVLDRADLTPAARGFVLGLRGDARALYYDFTNALSDLNKSLELDPANDVNYMLLATVLLRSGRIEESLKRASQAMALDPSSPMNNFALGLALLETGRNEDSLPPMRSACEVSSVYCVGYGRALSLAGHTDQALPRLAESCASRAPTCIEYACALARAGRLYEARAAAAKATDLPGNDWFAYTKAGFLALVGDRAEAIRTLKGAVSSGLLDGCIGRNPDFAPLRDEPEFRAIVAEVERRIRSD